MKKFSKKTKNKKDKKKEFENELLFLIKLFSAVNLWGYRRFTEAFGRGNGKSELLRFFV